MMYVVPAVRVSVIDVGGGGIWGSLWVSSIQLVSSDAASKLFW